jgi:hypothetical protein
MKRLINQAIYKDKQNGQIFILALIVLGLITVNTIVFVSNSFLFNQNSKNSLNGVVAQNLAEAGVDKAVASLNANAGNYNGESETLLGPGSYSVTITSKDLTTAIVQSTGYVPNKTSPKVKRTVTIQVSKGAGISFVYGLLTGNGGITMGNGSSINGSVYSNGNLTGGNNETVTGDVYVAGGTQPNADQQSDCALANCTDLVFGKNVSGSNQLDIAQSFKPSTSGVINKISLKLKKIGSPPNLTVRILGDNSGNPNKNNVLTSGLLSANLVTNQYGYVDVSFTSTPTLTAGTLYWIVLDTSSDNSNYWNWSMDTLQGYTAGSSKWSPDWQTNNPSWNSISGDLGFKTWMGGVATQVSMSNGSLIQGNVHAHTISGVTINKDAYYQLISNSTVKGTSYPNSDDPPPVNMPISASNISDWQSQAENAGISTGDISGCPSLIGPGKILGNISTGSNCTILVKTPVWITGNVTIGNSVILKMDPSIGASSGVIIVDGVTNFSNGDDLRGTGVSGSYLTLLSTYDSSTNGLVAIGTGNSSITGILYAPFGIITLSNNATFKEAVAWQINMGTGTILTYDSGLISTFFSAGPGGSYSAIKGSYQTK